jgi:5'-3' exoribonuclease 2
LDADLFFLSLGCRKKNIYLLREYSEIWKNEQNQRLVYVPIDIIETCVEEELNNKNIEDFIVVCYLLGNDFIPRLPTINIKEDGMELLFETYRRNNTKLVNIDNNNVVLDKNCLYDILNCLATFEKIYKKPMRRHINYGSNDPFEIEMKDLQFLNFQYKDDVKIGTNGWKKRYDDHAFKDVEMNVVVSEYIKGIIWIANYYFVGCNSWRWFYPFDFSPCCTDICNYLCNNELIENDKDDTPVKMIVQLLSIIPPNHSDLIEEKYRSLLVDEKSPIIDMFPIKYEEDYVGKDMWFQCNPILPALDIKRIEMAVSKL